MQIVLFRLLQLFCLFCRRGEGLWQKEKHANAITRTAPALLSFFFLFFFLFFWGGGGWQKDKRADSIVRTTTDSGGGGGEILAESRHADVIRYSSSFVLSSAGVGGWGWRETERVGGRGQAEGETCKIMLFALLQLFCRGGGWG